MVSDVPYDDLLKFTTADEKRGYSSLLVFLFCEYSVDIHVYLYTMDTERYSVDIHEYTQDVHFTS